MVEPERLDNGAPDLQRLVTRIAAALVKASPDSIDSIIEAALGDAGLRLRADRCTLYLFDSTIASLSFGHGWVRPGVPPLPLQAMGSVVADKLFPMLLERLMVRQTMAIDDVTEAPADLGQDAARLARMDIRSLLLVPMFAGDLPIGLLGVDRAYQPCAWSDRQRLFLEQIAAFLTQSLLRTRAERSVTEIEARYQVLAEHNQSILYELSLDGRFIFVAPNAETAVGYRPEEMLGKRFDHLLLSEDASRVTAEFSEAIGNPQALPVHEYRLRHRDGRLLWHRSIVAPVRDQRGRVTSLVCNALDVTNLKKAENELRREMDLTALLVRLAATSINLPVAQLDAAISESLGGLGRFVDADRAYVFRYDHQAGIARNTHEWCADGITPQLQNLQAVSMAGRQDFLQPHLAGELIDIPDVLAYPHAFTREILERQGIRSLIAVPMMHEGECVGFVGFDSVHRQRESSPGEVQLLRVFAQMLVNMQIRTAVHSQLERGRRRLSDIIDSTDAGTWEWDQQTQHIGFNRRYAQMMGYVSSEALPRQSRDWLSRIHPDDREASLKALISHLKGQSPHLEVELRLRHQQGHWLWVLVRGRVAARGADGRAQLMSGIVIDISQKKAAESDLQLAASVFTHSREGILITDLDGRILDVNQSFSRITGYPREEVLNRTPRILNSGRQPPAFYEQMWAAIRHSGFWSGEVWNRRRDGIVYAQRLTISTVCDSDGRPLRYVGLFSDITAQKQYQEDLERLAHFDVMTGLPNRVLMGDRIRQAMSLSRRQGQLMALAYIDIDYFKQINDTCGQPVGDRVLREVARRLTDAVRETDTIARPGGDEFVVVLSGIAREDDLDRTFQRLRNAIQRPLQVDDRSLDLTVSIGVTTYPQSGELEGDQLLRQADQAMYEAKRIGRNGICYFDAELERVHQQRQERLRRLRQAFAHDEFVLHYQPKVNLRTGQLQGVEALIRWQHPQRGLLAPSEFLPVIEGDELAHHLGAWVLSSALDDLARWQASGLEIGVAVNVSAGALLRGDFVESLRRELAARPQLEPGSLILEVVETSVLEDIEKANQQTRACAELGVRFALDDFGTGFSSLIHLKHLPIRQLKVDRSFVRDMLKDPDDLAIIEGVVRLGQAFGLEVLAEGVESDDHAQALLNLGCDLAQGYRISPAMPAAALLEWIGSWQAPDDWMQVPRLHAEQLPLLFAEAECKARLAQMEALLAAPQPEFSGAAGRMERSRFRQWLAARREDPDCVHVSSLLDQLDDLDAEIQQLLQEGERELAAARLRLLQALSLELMDGLRQRRAGPAGTQYAPTRVPE